MAFLESDSRNGAGYVVVESEDMETTAESILNPFLSTESTTSLMTAHVSTKLITSPADISSNVINSTDYQPHDLPFTHGAVVFSAVLLIPMAIFGLLANLITMIVISKSRTLKSIFNHLLISLCFSDLLSAGFSILPLYRQTWGFDHWAWPRVLCKASFAVDAWTTYVTTLHILLFAIFRLVSIQWPIAYKKIQVLQVRLIIVCVWLVAFACGFMPYAIMFEDVVRNRYSNTPDATWSHCSLNPIWMNQFIAYYKIAYPIFIYFPMAAIVVLCPTIGIVIRQRRKKYRSAQNENKEAENHRRKKERNAFLQLGFIVGSFLMGYIPNTAHVVYTTNVVPESMAMRVLEWNLFMMGYIFLRLSECLNPIFYNLVSSKMRKETFLFLGQCGHCKKSTGQSHSQSNGSSHGSSNGPQTTNLAL